MCQKLNLPAGVPINGLRKTLYNSVCRALRNTFTLTGFFHRVVDFDLHIKIPNVLRYRRIYFHGIDYGFRKSLIQLDSSLL